MCICVCVCKWNERAYRSKGMLDASPGTSRRTVYIRLMYSCHHLLPAMTGQLEEQRERERERTKVSIMTYYSSFVRTKKKQKIKKMDIQDFVLYVVHLGIRFFNGKYFALNFLHSMYLSVSLADSHE